ncbi:hypothetical protein [Myroides sp. WP-1]|uniref:hypothetical protein n=1 Tax=Myroides sp. WP-1 TaxID=2759944 RepID=UPI0015FCC591|nr:hypothetical protein [Myroides sp. WP-1]MBB1138768.1 hypothetical protein [Myroides sp. WP-1]
MRNFYFKLAILTLVSWSLFAAVGCSNDDHNGYKLGGKEKPKPGEPAAKATLKVEVVEVGEESISFKFQAIGAEKIYYLIQKKEQEVTEERVVNLGQLVGDATATQLVDALEADQDYVLYAVAVNKEGVATFDKAGTAFRTKKAADIRITITDVDSTNERVIFTVNPTGAVRMRYMVVEKVMMEGREMTAEEVLEEGSTIVKVDGPTALKPKGMKPNTDYIIYVAGVSATDTRILVSAEVRTKDDSQAPIDEELLQMTQMNFEGDAVDNTVVYYLYLSNEKWDVQFSVGAAQASEDVLKEGRYIRNASQGPGRPGADQVAKAFKILNKETGTLDTDIDYGEIRIAKTAATTYKVEIEMVRRSDATKRFKAIFTGIPVYGQPRS